MEKLKNGVFIFIGISILLAGTFIGGGLSEVAESINNQYEETDDTYRMIVQDGVIYMYHTVTGEVWKKEDQPNSKWENVEHLLEDW